MIEEIDVCILTWKSVRTEEDPVIHIGTSLNPVDAETDIGDLETSLSFV